jgi:hypothetical protein
MKIFSNKKESGQVIIILAVGLVVLLGLVALAIDGSMVFSERRHAQNAADAASLAGAYAAAYSSGGLSLSVIESTIISPPAIARALANGYQTDANTTVEVHYPPISGVYAEDGANYSKDEYVQVIISSKVNTSLIHFVYPGAVNNTVEAIAHFTPIVLSPLYNGNALVALCPDCCPGLTFGGMGGGDDSEVYLEDGGIYVNSSCDPSVRGNGNPDVTAPSITTVGDIENAFLTNPNTLIDSVEEGVTQSAFPPNTPLTRPNCATAPMANYNAGTKTYSPPTTRGLAKLPQNEPGQSFVGSFAPGVYCVNSESFDFHSSAEFTAIGVTFFVTDYRPGNGDKPCGFTWNAGSKIQIYAPNSTKDVNPPACDNPATDPYSCKYKGYAIFIDHKDFANYPWSNLNENGSTVINGSAGTEVFGTIYGPSCPMTFNGTAATGFVGQVISYVLTLEGDAAFTLQYVDADAGDGPTGGTVGLAK